MTRLTSNLENNKLDIFDIPQGSERRNAKLMIFLNSNKNLSYQIGENRISVFFKFMDDNLVSKEILKIINFIEKNFECEVLLDTIAKEKIELFRMQNNEFTDSIDLLNQIKRSDFQNNEDFTKFKLFCDKSLRCELRPYQYNASYFLSLSKGGFDFSVPGSGKTIISYSAYNYFKANDICNHILIIGPINSFNAWRDEYETCFDDKPSFVSLAETSIHDASIYLLSSSQNHYEITFINIDKAWRVKNEILRFVKNKKILLIIDEAHKEKNPNAEITKAVLDIAKYASCRIVLTGTPMPNGYEDLYSLANIYSPFNKLLKYSYHDLRKMTRNGVTANQKKEIMNSLFPVYSRVSKKFLVESKELLPAKYLFIKCNMSEEQEKIYRFLNTISYEMNNSFEETLNHYLMKAILIRKMQVSANPGLLSKSIVSSIDEYKNEYINEFGNDLSNSEKLIKADNDLKRLLTESSVANLIYKFNWMHNKTPKNIRAVQLVKEIVGVGEKVILWDVFVQNMESLKVMLEVEYKGKVEIINGTVTGLNRQNAIDRFKNGASMILIANPATLAESISLHKACQNAIYVNRNFNASQHIQSKDRIHRINMPEGTTAMYYYLLNEDTVDDAVNERLELKEKRMIDILDSDELVIGGEELESQSFMSDDDVKLSFNK